MFYIILIALWPVVNFLANNVGGLRFDLLGVWTDLGIIIAILCTICVSGVYLATKITKKPVEFFILPLLIAVAGFFLYAPIVEDVIGDLSKWGLKATYIWLAFYLAALAISLVISEYENVVKVSKILASATVIFALFSLVHNVYDIYYSVQESRQILSESDKAQQNKHKYVFKHKPNIYYILVDMYARQDTLKEVCGFDNEPFLKQLDDLGFAVSRTAWSNYESTVPSLSATLNMNYHRLSNIDTGQVVFLKQIQVVFSYGGLVCKIFRDNGYKIVYYANHFAEAMLGSVDKFIKVSSGELFCTIWHSTPLRVILFKYNTYVEVDKIIKALDFYERQPKFIFAHILQAHDAIWDESGENKGGMVLVFPAPLSEARYKSSIKSLNISLIKCAKSIIEKDNNAVIIIQADHGIVYCGDHTTADMNLLTKQPEKLTSCSNREARYRLGIFSAVYVPEHLRNYRVDFDIYDYFSGSFSLVNVFRVLFATLSEERPDLLPDRSIYLYLDKQINAYRVHRVYEKSDLEAK
ncbi:MAG: hypothetical protein LBL30_01445 [Holosporales bacterium]|jgi:hypothetical protein|nr:hypothetical protein [Holosporales bacterium]